MPEEAYALIEGNGYIYIDCRTEGEYGDGHVIDSILIPAFVDTPNGRIPVPDKFAAEVSYPNP